MFCKWCGVKKKGVENQCSNCKMPFEPLVSSGVPKGFPEQLHILKESDNTSGIIIESDSSGISGDSDGNTTNDTTKTEDSAHLLHQNRRLKIIIIILSGLLLISVVSILLLISQFVKKEDKADNIISEDTSVTDVGESGNIETNISESTSFSEQNDVNNTSIQVTETGMCITDVDTIVSETDKSASETDTSASETDTSASETDTSVSEIEANNSGSKTSEVTE